MQLTYGTPTSSASQKQHTMTLSTCEAEYISASASLQQTLSTRHLIEELQQSNYNDTIPETLPPTPLHVDNRSSIDVILHTGKTKRRKHFDVKHHHLHQHTTEENIALIHTPGTDNPPDALTQPLLPPAFAKHMNTLLTDATA